MTIALQIDDQVTPWVKRMQAAEKSPRLRKVGAHAGAKTVRQHFARLDRERHGSGPHHYYAQAARSTTGVVRGDDMLVVVDHVGIEQRFFGGTIRARRAKALTIPVKGSEAEGRRASEFDGLFAVMRDGGMRGFLARVGAGGKLEPLFWLRKSVTQKADPSVLPTEDKLLGDVITAMEHDLDRL